MAQGIWACWHGKPANLNQANGKPGKALESLEVGTVGLKLAVLADQLDIGSALAERLPEGAQAPFHG